MKQENGFPIWISLSALQIFIIFLSKILLTQTCSKDGLINETSGPYFTGMVVDSADTIYLTREEIDLITHYRNADADERKLTQKVLGF